VKTKLLELSSLYDPLFILTLQAFMSVNDEIYSSCKLLSLYC
jgi:hypothetical protein